MSAAVDVAVLGAGPAGLLAALALVRRGRRVVVVEQSAAVGGLAGSFEVAGVRVDHGSHRLHRACDPALLGLLRELLGDDLQRRARRGRLRLAGRWVQFPPRAADLARNLPPGLALRLALDAVGASLRTPAADTFDEVIRAGLGPTMYRRFYGPYVEKIWGIPGERLSGELARRRVGARSGVELLSRLRSPDPDARTFFYPRRGFGEIVERLADAAVAAGAELVLGEAVAGVSDRGEVRTTRRSVPAELVLSTIPLNALAGLVHPAPAPPVVTASGLLRYRALVLCYVVLERECYTEFDAHYFPGSETAASRVSEPTRYRDGAGTDPAGRTVLCIELPCSIGDATWTAHPSDLAARTMVELARCGLPAATPVHAEVRRVPHAYPVYDVGYEGPLATLDGWARSLTRIVTFGRQGLFAHDNTHHALAMGAAAAAAVREDGSFDAGAWLEACDRFRTHVVED
ncbi:MAG: FAD-dependent oxidoreductase [Actinobacteria bacterium]|nr:FAD-dependent oxidoreductase [Actinomycetota bacterium]